MPDGIELEPRKVLSLVPKSHRITTDCSDMAGVGN